MTCRSCGGEMIECLKTLSQTICKNCGFKEDKIIEKVLVKEK